MSNPSEQIQIKLKSQYMAEHSDPAKQRYVFIYDIKIRNCGATAIQLISRYWLISDGSGREEEVRGDGVVGEQPVIGPGKTFSYDSFCVLNSAVGCMQGSYQMQTTDGSLFDALIPAFTLAAPGSLN